MGYITIGRPPALPHDVLWCYTPRTSVLSLSSIQDLANNSRLHTTDDDIVLLVRNSPPPPALDAPSSVKRAACLLNDEPVRIYIRATAHAPSDNASLSFDGLLPPWHHGHTTHAGAFLLVDRHECMYRVVASSELEVPSAEKPTTDCPMADNLHSSPGRSRHRGQRRPSKAVP